MKILLLRGFNNYFNRIVKFYTSLADYRTNSNSYMEYSSKYINFNPNDHVMTELVIGSTDQLENSAILDWETNGTPDYLVAYEVSGTPPVASIDSRWFVLEAVRTRKGQYKLTLRRDVVADHYDNVVDAPTYIEKGYINSTNNPLLYNSEGLKVNQIKQYEEPLKDETKIGWVVGYVPRDAFSTSTTITSSAAFAQTPDIQVADLSTWSYWTYCNLNSAFKAVATTSTKKQMSFKIKTAQGSTSSVGSGANYYSKRTVTSYIGQDEGWWQQTLETKEARVAPSWYASWSGLEWTNIGTTNISTRRFDDEVCQYITSELLPNGLNSYVNSFLAANLNVLFDNNIFNSIQSQDGKILYDTTNKIYYKIRVATKGEDTKFTATTGTVTGTNLINFINSNLVRQGPAATNLRGNLGSGDVIDVSLTGGAKYIVLEQVVVNVTTTIDNNRLHLEDAPYDMFCIPYSDEIQMTDNVDTWTCNKAVALSLATDIGAQSGSGNIYDIQLLPYCPVRGLITGSPSPDEVLNITSCSYDIVTTTEATPRKITAVIWCPKSTFQFEISEIGNLDAVKFGEPFTDIQGNSIVKGKYYILPSTLTGSQNVGRISILSSTYNQSFNQIRVFEVDKQTEKATDLGLFNAVETCWGGESGTDQYVRIYSAGNIDTPEIYMLWSDYNNASYRLMFVLETDVFLNYNLYRFMNMWKNVNVKYFDVDLSSPEAAKQTNDCNLYRLSAGNYSAMFEFSPAKGGGFNGWLIDCTYKPFQPWIHVIPELGFLYGDNFVKIDDARGLICGGDYSLTQLTDVWANYKLNNKTYQEAFDRTISNMDTNNAIARQEAGWGIGAGIVQGAAAGATAGAMVGGGWGAAIGGIVGAGTSAVGGAMDYKNLLARQEEARSYAIDMYNFSLQNIQAIPTALSKTSALVANTRVWPFLEVYTCTDTEKQAYQNKIKYDGMTIMAIGKLSDYIDTSSEHFFKGEIIRLPAINDDSHIADEIYKEIQKGVYI